MAKKGRKTKTNEKEWVDTFFCENVKFARVLFCYSKKWSHFFECSQIFARKSIFPRIEFVDRIFLSQKNARMRPFFRFATKKKTYVSLCSLSRLYVMYGISTPTPPLGSCSLYIVTFM